MAHNPYEMVVLYHPDLEIDLEKALKKIEKLVTTNDGKITKSDNWGKRKLAYSIADEDHAIYVYYELELETSAIPKLESGLNIADEVIRYLISKPVPQDESEDAEDEEETKENASDKTPSESEKEEKATEQSTKKDEE